MVEWQKSVIGIFKLSVYNDHKMGLWSVVVCHSNHSEVCMHVFWGTRTQMAHFQCCPMELSMCTLAE